MANGSLEKNCKELSESVPRATGAMEEMAAKLERSEAGRKKLRLAITLLKEKVEASEKLLDANEILRKESEKKKLAAEAERNNAEEERRKRIQMEKEDISVKGHLESVLQHLHAVERENNFDRREIERILREVKESLSALGGMVKSLQDAQNLLVDFEKRFSEQGAGAVSTSRTSSTLVRTTITDAKAAQRAATAVERHVQSLDSRVSALEDKYVRLEQCANGNEQEQPARREERTDRELKIGFLDYKENEMVSSDAICRPTQQKQKQLSVKERLAVTDSSLQFKGESGKPLAPVIALPKKNNEVIGALPQHLSNVADISRSCPAPSTTLLKKRSSTSTNDQGVVFRGNVDLAAQKQDNRCTISKCVLQISAPFSKQDVSAWSLLRDLQKLSQKESEYHRRMQQKLADFENFLQGGTGSANPRFSARLSKRAPRKRKKECLEKSSKKARTQHVDVKSNLTFGNSENLGHTRSEEERSQTLDCVSFCQGGSRVPRNNSVHLVRTAALGSMECKASPQPGSSEVEVLPDKLWPAVCDTLNGNACPTHEPVEVGDTESDLVTLHEVGHVYGLDSESSDDSLEWWLERPVLLSPTLPDIPSPFPLMEIEEPQTFWPEPTSVQTSTEGTDDFAGNQPSVIHEVYEGRRVGKSTTELKYSRSKFGSFGTSQGTQPHQPCRLEIITEALGRRRSSTGNADVPSVLENSCLRDLGRSTNYGERRTSDRVNKLADLTSQKILAGSNVGHVVLGRDVVVTVGDSYESDRSQSNSCPETFATRGSVVDLGAGSEAGLYTFGSGLEMLGDRPSLVKTNGNYAETQYCTSDIRPGNSTISLPYDRNAGSHGDLRDPQLIENSKCEDDQGDVDVESKSLTSTDGAHEFKTLCQTGSEPADVLRTGVETSGTTFEFIEEAEVDRVSASSICNLSGESAEYAGTDFERNSSGLTERRNDILSTRSAFGDPMPGTFTEEDAKDVFVLPKVEVPTCMHTLVETPDVGLSLRGDHPDAINAELISASASECIISPDEAGGEPSTAVNQEDVLSLSFDPAVSQKETFFCMELALGYVVDRKIRSRSSTEELVVPFVTEASKKIVSICGRIQRILLRALNHGDSDCVHSEECRSNVAIEVASALLSSNLPPLDLLGILSASLVDSHALWDAEKIITRLVSEDRSLQLLIEIVKEVFVTEPFQRTLPVNQALSFFVDYLQRFLIFGSITLLDEADHRKRFEERTSSELLFHFVPTPLKGKQLMALVSASKLLAAFCEILGATEFLRNCVYVVLRFCVLDSSCLVATMASFAAVCCGSIFSLDEIDPVGQAIHLVLSELLGELVSGERLPTTEIGTDGGDDLKRSQPLESKYLIKESVRLPQLLGNIATLRKVVFKSDCPSLDALLTKYVELFARPMSPDFSSQLGSDRDLFQRRLVVYPLNMEVKTKPALNLYESKDKAYLSGAETGGTCNTISSTQIPYPTCRVTSPVEWYWQHPRDGYATEKGSTSQSDQIEGNTMRADRWKHLFYDVTSAMELLSSHLGWEWTYNGLIVERLWQLLGPGAQAITTACVAHLFGRLGRLGREVFGMEFPGVDELRKNLLVILTSGTGPSQLTSAPNLSGLFPEAVFRAQAAAAESLLLLVTCDTKTTPDSGKLTPDAKCPGIMKESLQYLRKWVIALEPEMQELLPLPLRSAFSSHKEPFHGRHTYF